MFKKFSKIFCYASFYHRFYESKNKPQLNPANKNEQGKVIV